MSMMNTLYITGICRGKKGSNGKENEEVRAIERLYGGTRIFLDLKGLKYF